LLLLVPAPAAAGEDGASGLPLPRFVSLAADKVNARTGPGLRYPVSWVFLRRAMPVEVVAEFEQWRRVRDHDGAEGWVHQAMLSGRRTVAVIGEERTLHSGPSAAAAQVARAEAGVQGRLYRCRGEWCEVALGSLRGWMRRAHLWGVYAEETVE
jgi:SH3-like domain-containing protein